MNPDQPPANPGVSIKLRHKMKTQTKHNRINRVLNYLSDNGEWIETAPDYAEPGYSMFDDDGLIVFADWNQKRFPHEDDAPLTKAERIMPRAGEILERLGCEIEWSDEWTTCCDCGKAIRTNADCYDWRPAYVVNGCEIFCENCVANDPEDYFDSLEGSTNKSHHISAINPENYGYKRLDFSFEKGFHRGQDDNPEDVAKVLKSLGLTKWFFEHHSSQFTMSFELWVHSDENQELVAKAIEKYEKDYPFRS